MTDTSFHLILWTCPNNQVAEQLATSLVEQRLSACINIVPGLTSIYRWQGKLEKGTEVLLMIKTTRERYTAVETAIRQQHPYELPEIIAVTLDEGSSDYLRWLTTSLEDVS